MTEITRDFESIFARATVMAIFRGMGVERTITLAETAWDIGIEAIEVTLQTDEDAIALRELAKRAAKRGTWVGAGTIIAPEQVSVAEAAGARYLVSPGLDERLLEESDRRGLPLLPGVATPTEVQRALALGLTWMKAFPATWLGTTWFSHLRGPFPQVKFVATGGLNASNVEEYLTAGVRVAAVGSALEDASQLPRLARLLRVGP